MLVFHFFYGYPYLFLCFLHFSKEQSEVSASWKFCSIAFCTKVTASSPGSSWSWSNLPFKHYTRRYSNTSTGHPHRLLQPPRLPRPPWLRLPPLLRLLPLLRLQPWLRPQQLPVLPSPAKWDMLGFQRELFRNSAITNHCWNDSIFYKSFQNCRLKTRKSKPCLSLCCLHTLLHLDSFGFSLCCSCSDLSISLATKTALQSKIQATEKPKTGSTSKCVHTRWPIKKVTSHQPHYLFKLETWDFAPSSSVRKDTRWFAMIHDDTLGTWQHLGICCGGCDGCRCQRCGRSGWRGWNHGSCTWTLVLRPRKCLCCQDFEQKYIPQTPRKSFKPETCFALRFQPATSAGQSQLWTQPCLSVL